MGDFLWKEVRPDDQKYLNFLVKGLELKSIKAFISMKSNKVSRLSFNGMFTLKADIGGYTAGIIYNDFRVKGGSFGEENSERVVCFFNEMKEQNLPIVFFLNSFGVRIMEGRKVFASAFKTLPSIKSYTENNLLITCTVGRCLGIGALAYDMGDYRLALKDETLLCLTGPEVFDLFFGGQVNFNEIANAKRQAKKTNTIHDISESKIENFKMIKELIRIYYKDNTKPLYNNFYSKEKIPNVSRDLPILSIIKKISDDYLEVFRDLDDVFRTFILTKNGERFGLFINTPGRPNMIKVETLQKYRDALKFFKKLELPVVSVVDTPGADPRVEQNDRNIIHELVQTGADIIDYPYKKLGVINGRCFGGASILALPVFFGGEKSVAIKGSQCGIMSENIIKHLLKDSPRLLEEWSENRAKESDDLSDLIDVGLIDKIIELKALSIHIERFLFSSKNPMPMMGTPYMEGHVYQGK